MGSDEVLVVRTELMEGFDTCLDDQTCWRIGIVCLGG